MTNGIRARAVSAPITSMELRELNKFKNKRICKEDLEIFVRKYEEKRNKFLKLFCGLPPEIKIVQVIANKYNSSFTKRTPISEHDKEILSNLIAMNKEHRAEKSYKPRLRDSIIDSMIRFLDLERGSHSQYINFSDYI